MNMSNINIEQEIARIIDLNNDLPSFLKKGKQMDKTILMPEGQRILNDAASIVANENPALYGDQVKYNIAVSEMVNLIVRHRSVTMGDATLSELVGFCYKFMKIIKGTVHNSDSYLQAAASLGIAAECAAKEDRIVT